MRQSSISPHTNTTMSSQAFILPRASPSPSEGLGPNHKTITQLALGRLDQIDHPAVFWPKDAIRLIKHKPLFDDASKYTLVRVIGALEALEKRWEGDWKGVVCGRTVGEFRDLMA
ncbi:hypothetical protein L198_07427 [Cryptococcus wingfieldii CBS 7118]|uniref:Uncharacterized protein n=1 Tax=Cryptococcus wingfieldii CBS 7118 TaxID=1295528 RepID=A0A1E3IB60_9TREE|nr:hypothetical protein L198_07427 [Cryptococcus wingfieldii CBS 7118]ODN85863.1 hypothetical protein L198_07427 [Cryptococcus wingfieldii CBS 7118]